jgi:isopentenyl phosphate kinase
MLAFLKLGGSLITDKETPKTADVEAITRLSLEIAQTLSRVDGLKLVLGHGSGSFGHSEAHKYGTAAGAASPEDWAGFADVAYAASELHRMMVDALRTAGVRVMSFKPSSSAVCVDGKLRMMVVEPIRRAVDAGLVPLVHGDVAFDREQGSAIVSTEDVFDYLAEVLEPETILLSGDYEGVMDAHGNLISEITPRTYSQYAEALGEASAPDVTGGMASKVQRMLALAERQPGTTIHIFSGMVEGNIPRILTEPHTSLGTAIRA